MPKENLRYTRFLQTILIIRLFLFLFYFLICFSLYPLSYAVVYVNYIYIYIYIYIYVCVCVCVCVCVLLVQIITRSTDYIVILINGTENTHHKYLQKLRVCFLLSKGYEQVKIQVH